MSRKVVLDGDTFVDALTEDALGVRNALIRACDRMVLNPFILKEYSKEHNVSALLLSPKLKQLERMRPPKALCVDRPQKKTIGMPNSHRELLEGARRGQADIVIASTKLRGKWKAVAETLAHFGLAIVKPEDYVAQRIRQS